MASRPVLRGKGVFTKRRPLFYYITDRLALKTPTTDALLCRARKLMAWGIDCIQVREKDLSDRQLFVLTRRMVALVRERKSHCRIIVNSRADIALAAGADGVHLPASGVPASGLRAWTPRNFIIGTSVHSLSEIQAAGAAGMDYVLVGHVYPTPSKDALGPALGLDFLTRATRVSSVDAPDQSSIPVLALGGLTAERIPAALATGVAGIAAISLFQREEAFARLAPRASYNEYRDV